MHVSSALKGDDGYGDCRRDNRSDRRFGDCAGGECVEAQTDAGGRSFAAKQRDGDRRGGAERFREILRSKTVWAAADPNADHTAFDEFVPKLRRLYPRVFETCELEMIDTYGISLLWKGENREVAPVLFMAHHDVVEADPTGWTHDPFAADVGQRGALRGVVDTKCIWAALMEAAESLIAEGYMPPRDVYFFSSNTEEDGGDTAPHMVERSRKWAACLLWS